MTARRRDYALVQVDVFTDHLFGGNPLAVFPHAEGLSDTEMQAIATEMNLSETTFVLPATRPDCDVAVRIFTPGRELPFAGHPTIGTAFVLATEGRVRSGSHELLLEEQVGPVPVLLEGDPTLPDFLWMRHGGSTFEPEIQDRSTFARAVGLEEDDLLDGAPVQVGSTGVPFLYLPLRDRETVDRARSDATALRTLWNRPDVIGAFVFAVDGPDRLYSRMFAPHTIGVPEDPATGSGSGPLGVYAIREGLVNDADEVRIISEQGTAMGRQSLIHIRLRKDGGDLHTIEVGGSVVHVLEGTLHLT